MKAIIICYLINIAFNVVIVQKIDIAEILGNKGVSLDAATLKQIKVVMWFIPIVMWLIPIVIVLDAILKWFKYSFRKVFYKKK